MPDFLSRLIKRNMGLSKVAQPVVLPMFANEIAMRDNISTKSPPAEMALKSEKERVFFPLSYPKNSSANTGPKPIQHELYKASIPEKSSPSERMDEYPKKIETQDLLVDSDKSKHHKESSAKKRIKEVISTQSSTTTTSAQKKPDLDAFKLKFERKKNPSTTTEPEIKPIHKGLAYTRNTNKKIPENNKIDKKVVLRKKQNPKESEHHNIKVPTKPSSESPSFSPLPVNKFIRPEVSVVEKEKIPSQINHQTNEQRESTTLPSIKVTIGRIDVRAIKEQPLSPAQRRTVTPKPSISLEDYLKQSNRG